MITGQKISLCVDLRDRFNALLRAAHDCHDAAAGEEVTGLLVLDTMEDRLAEHLDRMRALVSLWASRPYRGERPPLRVCIALHIDSRGTLSTRWEPVTGNPRDARALKDLARSEFGTGWDQINCPGASSGSERMDEQLTRTALKIPDLLASVATAGGVPARITTTMRLNGEGQVERVDTEATEREGIEQGLQSIAEMNWINLAEALYAADRGMSAAELKSTCLRLSRAEEIDYHEAARALYIARRIREYNGAWWRTASRFDLPSPRHLRRKARPGRRLVRINGSKPRHSAIAPRGNEGKRVVARGRMKAAIQTRIDEHPVDWVFTAGDFSDFARAADRRRITTALEALSRDGHVRSLAKGLYCRSDAAVSDLEALRAITRDRGECCTYGARSSVASVTGQTPLENDYFTSGSLKVFRIEDRSLRVRREPVTGLCETADASDCPEAVVAMSLHLSGDQPLHASLYQKMCDDYPSELRVSMGLTGTML